VVVERGRLRTRCGTGQLDVDPHVRSPPRGLERLGLCPGVGRIEKHGLRIRHKCGRSDVRRAVSRCASKAGSTSLKVLEAGPIVGSGRREAAVNEQGAGTGRVGANEIVEGERAAERCTAAARSTVPDDAGCDPYCHMTRRDRTSALLYTLTEC